MGMGMDFRPDFKRVVIERNRNQWGMLLDRRAREAWIQKRAVDDGKVR